MHQFDSGRGLPKMQKSALVIIFVLSTLYFVLSGNVQAQNLTFERANQDYQYSLSLYNQAYSDYRDARDFYLSNKTLALKEDARIKTLSMLRTRDQLLIVYLTNLRAKISETKGLSDADRGAIFGKIDTEVEWFTIHKTTYDNNDSLESLFTKSDEVKDRYKTSSSPILYESLFDISLGQEVGLRQDQETIYTTLRSTVEKDVASGTLNSNTFSRFFKDIDGVIADLKQNEDKAKTQIQLVYNNQYYTAVTGFNQATDTLTLSAKSLTQLNKFLTEVLASIKNQQ